MKNSSYIIIHKKDIVIFLIAVFFLITAASSRQIGSKLNEFVISQNGYMPVAHILQEGYYFGNSSIQYKEITDSTKFSYLGDIIKAYSGNQLLRYISIGDIFIQYSGSILGFTGLLFLIVATIIVYKRKIKNKKWQLV